MKIQYVGKKFAQIVKKELARQQRMAVYRASEGDYVYAVLGAFALKIPAAIYETVLQPVALQAIPAPDSGFWCGPNGGAPAERNIVDMFENAAKAAATPAKATPWLINDAPGRIARVIAFEDCGSAWINDSFFGLFAAPVQALEMFGAKKISPIHVKDTFIEAVICPIRQADDAAPVADAIVAQFSEGIRRAA